MRACLTSGLRGNRNESVTGERAESPSGTHYNHDWSNGPARSLSSASPGAPNSDRPDDGSTLEECCFFTDGKKREAEA